MELESEAFLVITNRADGLLPDPGEAVGGRDYATLVWHKNDAMQLLDHKEEETGDRFGVYQVSVRVEARVDLDTENTPPRIDPDKLNDWQRLVLEDYPARSSILADVRSARDRARILKAGLADEDQILADAVAALGACGSAEEALRVVERASDLAWRLSQSEGHALTERYNARHYLTSIAEEIAGTLPPKP